MAVDRLDARTTCCDVTMTRMLTVDFLQRQTVVSQFYQLDKLVVEGGKSVCSDGVYILEEDFTNGSSQGKQKGGRGDIVRQKEPG